MSAKQSDALPHATRKSKGQPGWLGLLRKLFWSWWLWVLVAAVAQAAGRGNLAAVLAGIGFFFYLLAPRERVPNYGLEAKFPVCSNDFLSSVVGATGVPFLHHNKVTILTDGDEFYPAMLQAIASAKR